MAAVLACGKGAVLSYRAAAACWGLLPHTPGLIDVTVLGGGGRRRRRGICLHRTRSLPQGEVTRRQGIPLTTVARTIRDLRPFASSTELRRVIREAALRGIEVEGEADTVATRSELEYRFLRLCRRHRLPPPEVNAKVGRFTVDFLWRDRGLIVETDGYRYHRGRQAFEEDRVRDMELRTRGFEVLRLTHRQLTEDPGGLAAALAAILSS
ncbi:MAG: endonuclease domain-containing protein [Solirubrobacterales bacterium]